MLNISQQQCASTIRFWLKHLLPALLFILLMLLVYPNTDWDTRIAGLLFDRQLHQLMLTTNPMLTGWIYIGLKWLIAAVALASLVLVLLSYRLGSLRTSRLSLVWVLAGILLSTAAVAIFQHYSQHDCPWAIALPGGNLALFDLINATPAGAEAGPCFFAGHPLGGFALMAFYFAFMHIKPRFALLMLWFGMLVGMLMGVAQMIRGVNFLSHVLWCGCLVWMILLALYWLWPVGKSQNSKSQSASLALLMLRE